MRIILCILHIFVTLQQCVSLTYSFLKSQSFYSPLSARPTDTVEESALLRNDLKKLVAVDENVRLEITDLVESCVKNKKVGSSDFLPPAEYEPIRTILRKYDFMNIYLEGGYPQSYYKRLIISPKLYDIEV